MESECGSEEFYAAVRELRRSAKLLAGAVHALALLAGREDIASMVRRIAEHYADEELAEFPPEPCDYLEGEEWRKCIASRELERRKLREAIIKDILGLERV